MKVLTVIGTRPDIVKAALRRPLFERSGAQEVLVHTGQHYDHAMSQAFFDDLDIPPPDYRFTGRAAEPCERMAELLPWLRDVLERERPDVTYVYGDVDATLSASIASARLRIPLAHAEAGVRTEHRHNPEEINRRLSDHLADTLFPVTESCRQLLLDEGIAPDRMLMPGDPTLDMLRFATARFGIPVVRGDYVLATIHRAENADCPERLEAIVEGLLASGARVVFPVHPRTRKSLERTGLHRRLEAAGDRVCLRPPLGYVEFLRVAAGANKVVTDSGTVRREAYLLGKPVITPIEIDWWPEIGWCGWNAVIGRPDSAKIADAIANFEPTSERPAYFGDGHAEERIVAALLERYG